VGVVGSETPWYECIANLHGAEEIFTFEYRNIDNSIPEIRQILKPNNLRGIEFELDALLCISSIEHDGLGRYGDRLNPAGDIEAMGLMKRLLKRQGGLLFLSVPIGPDCLVWNAHRIYGGIRLPMLLDGWNVIATYPSELNFNWEFGRADNQPIFVLEPIH
jgi:hypothetical protein